MNRMTKATAAGAVAVLAAILLTSCASGSGGSPASPPPSCGAYRLGQGQVIPQEAVDCFAEAGVDGVLKVTAPTTEGDPIITTYSRRSDGAIEVQMDMTQDPYGGGTAFLVCPDAVSVVELGDCEEQHRGD
ncbi:hypothetical protein [Microbacterium sp. 2FI]|uniref:hypothetical protein n=1 Tax=Microbacterium sp. 2FI TaxID=2502193 RepID=UPI0010F44DF6|nr:hypothetical protein [Microbacterium sp. 2FI]